MRKLKFFIGLIIFLTACTAQSNAAPQDFQVVYKWNTGALPPQYTYSYSVAIGPGLRGSLEYQPDYGDEGATYQWEEEFSLSQQDLDELYATLQELDLLRHDWKLGETAEGSPGSSLVITVSGEEYHIPSIAQLSHEENKNVDAAIEAVRIVVPREIWDEMNTRQEEYEMNYEEE